MDIGYLLDDKYTPKERRSLLMKTYIHMGLEECDGSRRATADLLGMSPRTIRSIISKHKDLLDEYPPRILAVNKYGCKPKGHLAVNKYECKPKRHPMDRNEKRKYKSILREKFKIKGKQFDSITDIAIYYNVPMYEAELWIKNRMTEDRDFIRIITVPVDANGKEISIEDFDKLDSREWGKV